MATPPHSVHGMSSVSEIALAHILKHIQSRKSLSPLFIAIQGPQGIGKTTLCTALVDSLQSHPHNLRVVSFSIDDLYYGHEEMRNVEEQNKGNGMLAGRGLPGTHDVTLGAEILEKLQNINQEEQEIKIPAYDKSRFAGHGDRRPLSEWTTIQEGVDVIILEGWCMGFYPLSLDELRALWDRRDELGFPMSVELKNGFGDVKTINENLKEYVDKWYQYFGCFVQIAPVDDDYKVIYKWRLQQEYTTRAANGGQGMTDEEVARFIDRYIPGYIFFGKGPRQGSGAGAPPWAGSGCRILIDEARIPCLTETF